MFSVLMGRNWSHGIGPAVVITLLAGSTSATPTTPSRWPGFTA
jgi:hypothetical protein